jgi:hypothetical protein
MKIIQSLFVVCFILFGTIITIAAVIAGIARWEQSHATLRDLIIILLIIWNLSIAAIAMDRILQYYWPD